MVDVRLKRESTEDDYDEREFSDGVIFGRQEIDVIVRRFPPLDISLVLIMLSL